MPAKAFSAPGPYCMAKTPGGRPFKTRAQPSAMCTPTRSWRQITGRMPAAAAASMIGVVGKQNIVEMPSRFRISVIASMTSIGVAPFLESRGERSATSPSLRGAKRGRNLAGIAPPRRRRRSGESHEDCPHRDVHPRHRQREGPAAVPGRGRGRDLWLGRGLCHARPRGGHRHADRQDGGPRRRPRCVPDPPHRPGHVRRFRDQARLDGTALGVERDRDRLVGHHRQDRRATRLQSLGRRLARAGAGLCQRLGRPHDDRRRGRACEKDQGDGLDRRDEDFAIDYVAAMREALGPDFEILVEAHRRFAPQHAIRIGRRLEALGIEWYEEPCLADNLALLAEVRDKVNIPIVTGEALYTKESFCECLSRRAADILNPDICAIGGISALMDIAVMAQPHAVVMSPHNYNSPLVGMAATLHVSAVIPNFKITEYFVNFEPVCGEIAAPGLIRDGGWLDLPTAPGLGIDIDVARLRAHPHREVTEKGFRQYWEEYPRKGYRPSLQGDMASP